MEIKDRNLWVYDIETLKSLFTYTAKNVDTKEVVQFVIHKDKNQAKELREHLKICRGMIGFNTLDFDYPIIHLFLKLPEDLTAEEYIEKIYDKAQKIINSQSVVEVKGKFNSHTIWEKDMLIPQVDLYKVWHYNNTARRTSLKALEISMNFPNVMEMEVEHWRDDIRLDEIPEILEYNLNDVEATEMFWYITVEYGKIELRKSIKKDYNLQCLNWNNGKIGEQLILKLYSEATDKDPWEVKKMRSPIDEIKLIDCIPPGIKFETPEFKSVLKAFEDKIVNVSSMKEDKGKSKKKNRVASILFKECLIDYGLGGVHGCCRPGVYESTERKIIKTCDVASLYPWLPIVYKFWIRHLGPEFLEVYRDNIVQVRLNEKKKPKAEQNLAIVDGFKEGANIPYGKSNEDTSFLYDPLYTMKTTVSGQLATSMLAEKLGEIPECELIMYNTDGLEVRIPRDYEDKYYEICKQWEKDTGLVLEFADYKKMWIGDVNNYGCVTTTGKIKNKGRFEVDKMIGNERAYHKDNSFRVIPLALQEYFTKGVPVEETIKSHKNIYDFCGRQRFKGEDYGEIHYIERESNGNPIKKVVKQQKNVRYFISNRGAPFIKQYKKGSCEFINKGYSVTVFNKYYDSNNYDIDYSFYIAEANKEISLIDSNQLTLF